MARRHFFFVRKQCIITDMKKKNRNKLILFIGVGLIIALTALLLFLPGGKKDPVDTTALDGPATEEEPADISDVTEEMTETPTEAPVLITAVPATESTEEPTEALVDGAGSHAGKLGSSFNIPEGFYDISPKGYQEGYFYVFENPERKMRLQVAEYHLEERRVGFDGEYTVYHNMYKNDPGTDVTYDKKEDNHYVISGYSEDYAKIFYIESYKYADRNEVQIMAEYPNDGWKETCDGLLDVLLDSYTYTFISNPDQKQTEADPFADPYADPGEDPNGDSAFGQ